MKYEATMERLFEVLITGDRPGAGALVDEITSSGVTAENLIMDYFWPTYEKIDQMYRADQLSAMNHHMATRLLRVLVDRHAAKLARQKPNGRTILAFCGPSESDEMGAQMAVDMLEAGGFGVTFAGGGIANDEVLAHVNEHKPDVLLMFASAPSDLPNIRALVDTIDEIGACPNVQIAVGGGVFNRADGLAEEVGADIWADSPLEMVDRLLEEPTRRAEANQRTVGKVKKRRMAA